MNIYVGNLTPDTTEDELREAFASYGEITTIKIIRDGATGESRGFGFVEMASEDQAKAAITEMNGKELKGNQLHVEAGRAKAAPTGFGGGGGGRRPGGSDRPRGGGGGRPGGRPGGGGGRPGGRYGGGGGGGGGRGGDRGGDRGGSGGGGRPRY